VQRRFPVMVGTPRWDVRSARQLRAQKILKPLIHSIADGAARRPTKYGRREAIESIIPSCYPVALEGICRRHRPQNYYRAGRRLFRRRYLDLLPRAGPISNIGHLISLTTSRLSGRLIHGHFSVSLLQAPLLGNHVEPIVFFFAPLFAIIRHPPALRRPAECGARRHGADWLPDGARLGFDTTQALLLGAILLLTRRRVHALHEFHPKR